MVWLVGVEVLFWPYLHQVVLRLFALVLELNVGPLVAKDTVPEMVEDDEVDAQDEDFPVEILQLPRDPLRVFVESYLAAQVSQVNENANEAKSIHDGLLACVRVQLVEVALVQAQTLLFEASIKTLFDRTLDT